MIHILFVGHECRANGASRSMLNLIDELADRCTFSVVLPYKEGAVIDELRRRNVKLYYVPFRRWAYEKTYKYYVKKALWYVAWNRKNEILAKELCDRLKNEKIDIIHSNSSVIEFGDRLSRYLDIPHLWHIREFGERDFNVYPLVSYTNYFKTLNHKQNFICCISKAVAKKFEGKVPKDRVSIIYNGVGREHLNFEKKYEAHKEFVCLQAGYINEAKGQSISIKAIQELNNRGIKDIKLLLAGRGNVKRIGFKLEELHGVKELGVINNLPEIRQDVDVEIVASREEAFGRVTVEAMMGGIPVVGSKSGGTTELITDGENGLLFEPGNYMDLADKLQYLYEHRDEIQRLGQNAFAHAKDFFLIKRCADEVYELYRSVLGKNV